MNMQELNRIKDSFYDFERAFLNTFAKKLYPDEWCENSAQELSEDVIREAANTIRNMQEFLIDNCGR